MAPKSVFIPSDLGFPPRRTAMVVRFLFSVVFLVCLAGPRAHADVGVVLNESLDSSVDRITGTGHSAVYFSRICPDSPVKLRLCRSDEQGSVMSNYINIGEDQPFEWNVVSLNMNDFGMTSPKAVARTFTRYALRHPEANFRVQHFAQVPGTIKRSRECRAGTEQLYHSKKFLIPMIVFADHELPVVVASYVLTGRFNPQRQLEQHPTAEAAEIGRELQLAKTDEDKTRAKKLQMDENLERRRVVGTAEEWKEYRQAFGRITEEAIREELIPDSQRLPRYFKNLDEAGTPFVDEHGALWMEIQESGRAFKVGLSANNILAPGSDSLGAYELLLVRTDRILKSPKHSRESMLEFRLDWAMLQRASEKNALSLARNAIPGKTGRTMFLSGTGDD